MCKVYVYEDLDGKAEITGIEEIKLKNAPSCGWTLSNERKLKVENRVISSLRQATAKWVGATLKPLLEVLGRAKRR